MANQENKKISEMSEVEYMIKTLANDIKYAEKKLIHQLETISIDAQRAIKALKETPEDEYAINSLGIFQSSAVEADRLCGVRSAMFQAHKNIVGAFNRDKAKL